MGSGKSRAIVEEVIQSGLDYPGIPMAVYRKTMPSLRDSTMREYRGLVPEGIGEWREREDSYYFHNRSLIAFRGLDDPNKAKSTNYGLIVMEEADEFSYEDFVFLNARVRSSGPWPLRIILLLNPVDEDHWIYKQFVENAESWEKAGRAAGAPKGLEVIHFRTYDNIKNLPPGYIEQISAGMTSDEIDRYINGNWGTIVKGERVYGKIMNPALHIMQPKIDSSFTLLRGWDFGFNHPACAFRVVDPFGRKNINFELMGDKEDLETFARRVLEVTRTRYNGLPIFDYCDPRGHDKKDTGDSSVSLLNGLGIWPTGERGVRDYVEPGIQIVRKELSTLIEGIPELTISPEAPILRAAYFNRYVRDEDGRPVKDGYYDHLCFVKDTMVDTSNGQVPIQHIKVGDLVWTRSGLKPVESVMSRVAPVVSNIGLTGTPDHPVWTDGGWKPLCAVTGDDVITVLDKRLSYNESDMVNEITAKDFAVPPANSEHLTSAVVYNLTVKDAHEYFANGILVSNCDADRYIAYHHKSNSVVRDLILAHKARKRQPRNRYTGY